MARRVPAGCAGSGEWTAMFRTGCRGLRPRRFRIPGRLPDTMESFGGKVQEEEAWRRSQENRRTA